MSICSCDECDNTGKEAVSLSNCCLTVFRVFPSPFDHSIVCYRVRGIDLWSSRLEVAVVVSNTARSA